MVFDPRGHVNHSYFSSALTDQCFVYIKFVPASRLKIVIMQCNLQIICSLVITGAVCNMGTYYVLPHNKSIFLSCGWY